MKNQSVLNVLMYLFKNHMQENCTLNFEEKKSITYLEDIGFSRTIIEQALKWLSNLSDENREFLAFSDDSFRVFSDYECDFLDMECRQFLLNLEQQGILNAQTRELVLNQALELASENIDVALLKWVTLLVLFNQPDSKHVLESMELLVLADPSGGVH